MKLRNLLTAGLTAMALFTAGCVGGGDSANKMDTPKEGPVELQVSAAASLTDAMKELGAMYEENNKEVHIVYNFGSSGALQQAIENGGAADVFVSAAQKQMNALDEKKLLAGGTRVDLLVNDIVLITAKDSKLNLPDFKAVLDPQVAHIALGEPKGVPVGQYSEEVFTKLGILDQVKARAVYGSDVRQVLAWVETGDADCGVVYATDAAISDKVKVAAVAPADTHKPIVYPAAVLKDSKNEMAAKEFLAFLQTDKAAKVFEKYGFTVK